METFFTVGVSMPSGFSHYASKRFDKTTETFDVIIVPGIPYDPTTSSAIMKMRILWAKYLFDNGITRNIIFSGSAVYSPYIEGVAMKIIADSLGIPSDHTFFEVKAEHSTENVYYSWKMAKDMGFERIALATDPFQSFALRGFIEKYCPDVASVPVVYKKLKADGTNLPSISLKDVYVDSFVSIVDRETFAERFEGTRGFKVADEVRQDQTKSFLTATGPSLTKK
jgi:uncharacterized SAM-binding protein YcdF (DUF218 family)